MLELKQYLRLAACITALVSNSLFASFSSDWGSLPLQIFSPKTYNAHPQVWSAVQDSRGVMYFANPDGVLEFDGVTWRRIPIPGNAAVRSVTADSQGRIGVGAQGEFGILEHDAQGLVRYRSLCLVAPLVARVARRRPVYLVYWFDQAASGRT